MILSRHTGDDSFEKKRLLQVICLTRRYSQAINLAQKVIAGY